MSLRTINEQLHELCLRQAELLVIKQQLLQPTPDEIQGAVDEVIGQYNDFRADEFVSETEWLGMVLEQIECAREDEVSDCGL